MTTVVPFRKRHMRRFRPGAPEREWHSGIPPRRIANVIHEDAALTILDGPRVLGFCGVRDYGGSLCLWSMWSAQARAYPLPMCRTMRRLLPAWREECGMPLMAPDLGREPQAKLARWLGMCEREPGVWTI